MRTPESYAKNLKDRVITTEMLGDCLYSVNKRAKNYRNLKRKARHYRHSHRNYAALNECKEQNFYAMKEKLLSIAKPVCIHKEFAGFERIRVMDYEPDYYDLMLRKGLKGEIVWVNSFSSLDWDFGYGGNETWFFDYIDKSKPKFRWYLYYSVGNHTFHTPIDENAAKCHKELPVKEIGQIVTDGHDTNDLISVQFVSKVIDLIDSGNYRFESNEEPETGSEDVPCRNVDAIPFDHFYNKLRSVAVNDIKLEIECNESTNRSSDMKMTEVEDIFRKRIRETYKPGEEVHYKDLKKLILSIIKRESSPNVILPKLTDEFMENILGIPEEKGAFDVFSDLIKTALKNNGSYQVLCDTIIINRVKKKVIKDIKSLAEEYGLVVVYSKHTKEKNRKKTA